MTDHVLYEQDGQIGRLTFNRPDTMNALSEEVMEDLFQKLRIANADRGTRVIVISGEGKHFCAGGDLNWEGSLDEESSTRLLRLTGHLSYELRNGPKPTIGAIRGYCLGGGNELNLHLDLAIASETARFSQPETRWGVLPFWHTPQLLPLVVGERRAREILMMGRMYDAQQAYEMGLCNLVVPDDELEEEATSWARELCVRSAMSLRLVKIALNSAADALRGSANHEAALVSTTAGSSRYQEEVHEFFETAPLERRPLDAWPQRVRATPRER
jgi:enoyl-CoA hydratase/carnithine racemase